MTIDDLQSNFGGLPGYVGPRPATLLFVDVLSISLGVTPVSRHMSIYAVGVKDTPGGRLEVEIMLSPGGRLRVECGAIELEEKAC